jgi:hypothetical protein
MHRFGVDLFDLFDLKETWPMMTNNNSAEMRCASSSSNTSLDHLMQTASIKFLLWLETLDGVEAAEMVQDLHSFPRLHFM